MSSQTQWRPDPSGQFELRWWDGSNWTDQVSQDGKTSVSPLAAGSAGSNAANRPSQGGINGVVGELVDGRFSENEQVAIANQNSKMLRVRLGEAFVARQGSMVAYQGEVDFSYKGAGGLSKFIKKAVTGEGFPTMKVSGKGDVFLADQAKDVHLLHLQDTALSINGTNLLAYSESLECNIERVKGASMLAGGLFNTTLRGSGWVAITTDGSPVLLNTSQAPTYADTQAIVCWSAGLQTKIASSFKASALIGRGSGEMFQLSFTGQGFIVVQPSEGIQQFAGPKGR